MVKTEKGAVKIYLEVGNWLNILLMHLIAADILYHVRYPYNDELCDVQQKHRI